MEKMSMENSSSQKSTEEADLMSRENNMGQTILDSEIMQKNWQNQETLQEDRMAKEREDERKIKEIMQKISNSSMGEVNTGNHQELEYTPQIKKFLDNAPENIKAMIEKLSYYHVTHKNFGESIIKEGIKKDSEIFTNDDVDFIKEMFNKYGDRGPISERFFKYHILGQDEDEGRSIWVSSSVMADNYQTPEKIKFLLQNLNFLKKSKKLTSEEREICQNMLDRYLATFKDVKDGVYVLKIKATSPHILNEILGGYELNRISPNLIKKILSSYKPNLEIKQDIPAKYISIEEKRDFNYEALIKNLEDTSFLVFED